MNEEYAPLFDVAWFFTELYEHATASSSSQAAVKNNPLSLWTKDMSCERARASILELPSTGTQSGGILTTVSSITSALGWRAGAEVRM